MDAAATLEQNDHHHGQNNEDNGGNAAIAAPSITNGKRQRNRKKSRKPKRERKSARHATNKHINAKNQREAEETGKDARLTPQHLVCPVCLQESPDGLVDISTNVIMRQALSSYLDGPTQNVDNSLSSVCVQCVYKINVHREMTRTLKIRLHRLTNGQIQSASQNHLKERHKNDVIVMENAKESVPQEQLNHTPACAITIVNVDKATTTLPSPEVIRALSEGDTLRLPTPPLTADLSTPTTPEAKEKHATDQIDSRNGSLSPPPPPYSPLRPRSSVERETNLITKNRESPPPKQPEASAPATESAPQSPRVPYIVQVEDVTPVKDVAPANENVISEEPLYQPVSVLRNEGIIDSVSQAVQRVRSQSDSNSNQSVNAMNHSMLKVICERSESALVTESGGKINNYERIPRAAIQMLCQHCGRCYMRKDYYNKHVRRCQAQRRWTSVSGASENVNKTLSPEILHVRLRANDAKDEGMSTEAPQRVARIFYCPECPVTLLNASQLRRHKQTHLRQYSCEACESKFTTLREHEFHRIICLAKQEAQKEQKQVQAQRNGDTSMEAKSTVSSSTRSRATTTVSRRVTRAQSRAQSRAHSQDTTVTAKRRYIRVGSSVSQYTSFYTDDAGEEGEGGYANNCSDVDNNGDEDLDDEVSVADSMYSKRRCFTGNWVDTLGSSGIYNLPALKIDTWKQYDLYLLELLKAQIEANFFYCLEPGCCYSADNLLNLMLHDYINHFKSSWFYCQKCGCVFTSKVFLDYHLDRQNGGRFICYKCNEEFVFQHQLDWHLIHHSKSRNFACNSCNCEFLSELKLYQHIRNEHSDEMRSSTICIESMTENVPRADNEMKSKRRTYQKCIRLLEGVKKMPSNRPMQLPGHKPYRRHIGIIEFTNERNPNCWSWK